MEESFELPDIDPDTDFSAFVAPGADFKTIEPGSPEWDEAEKAMTEPEEVVDDAFPPEIDQDLRGLMFLGSLQKSFPLLGHNFLMKTLKAGEELACSQIVKEFEGTLGQTKAFATAFVGGSIISVDNIPMTQPLGPDQTLSVIRQRFNYITEHWYWPVIEALYEEYSELVVRQANVFRELEGKLQASRLTS